MGKTKLFSLLTLVAVILASCNLLSTPEPESLLPEIANTATITTPLVTLDVRTPNADETVFNTVGQEIRYRYIVTNVGIVPLAGPVLLVDDKTTVKCPEVNTVGNLDASLDANESIVCTSSYAITQTDLTNGKVTNLATASVGGFSSSQVSTTVNFTPPVSALKLTKSASPLTYNQVGQIITYTYVIQNTGTAAIGPVQFTITDNKFAAPFNCGVAATTLAPQQTLTCTSTYAIVQADLTTGSVTNSATASGGGANVSAAVTSTITLASSSSGLTRGSSIQHKVVVDEWMIQIARCYAANYDAVRKANPQILNPHIIEPGDVLTIPNIGSNGVIYGPPCVGYHTVQSGDTWDSIARRYNADVIVLQVANLNVMTVGKVLIIPLNSAGSITSTPIGGTTLTPTVTPTPTLTPTPTPTATTSTTQSTRITFPTGSTSATITATLTVNATVRYVLGASVGQTLTVNLTAPTNQVAMSISDPAGLKLKLLDTTLTWTGVLTTAGDHTIELVDITGVSDKPYTMVVSLTGP